MAVDAIKPVRPSVTHDHPKLVIGTEQKGKNLKTTEKKNNLTKLRSMFLYWFFTSLMWCRTSVCIHCFAYFWISSSSETVRIILLLWLHSSPKCKKTFSSFLSILSWSLVRSSWYCCCLIFDTMCSASCKGKQSKELRPDNLPAQSYSSHWSSDVRKSVEKFFLRCLF